MPLRHSIDVTRRRAFLIGAGALVMFAVPAITLCAVDRLRRISADPSSAQEIGRAYLTTARLQLAPDQLAGLLLEGLGLQEADLAGLTDGMLRRAVDVRVRADFAEDHTIDIDGWILSLTEVRLAALWV